MGTFVVLNHREFPENLLCSTTLPTLLHPHWPLGAHDLTVFGLRAYLDDFLSERTKLHLGAPK